MDARIMDWVVRWWLKRNYGKCPDYERGCVSCDAWVAWDAWWLKYVE